MSFNVIVLGSGPAGLVAADTAVRFGARVIVTSRGDGRAFKSDLHGCQYLHAPVVPNIGDPVDVKYSMVGTSEGYREKVYGELWSGKVSTDEYGKMESHRAWDIRRAYDNLWNFWGHRIYPMHDGLDHNSLNQFLDRVDADLVVSSIPAPALCRRQTFKLAGVEGDPSEGEVQHIFTSQNIWAIGETPRSTIPIPCEDDSVVYNGERDTGWYRKARVFGHTTVEWPWRDGRRPPFNGVVRVRKPLRTNCDCWISDPGGIPFLRVGRYGKWEKGYLVHQVAEDVEKALNSLQPRMV